MTCGLATALEPPHFNHAPVRGAIGAIQYVAGYVTKFQSTHPRGVRRNPKGSGLAGCPGFNPRTRVGCDPIARRGLQAEKTFQSTHPRGVRRPTRAGTGACIGRFNPRTRVGCDRQMAARQPACTEFQSTHPRGVRPAPSSPRCHGTKSFNPRTRVGCDSGSIPGICFCRVSIHAPAWGATVPCLQLCCQ